MITFRVLEPREVRRYEHFLKQRNMDTRTMYFGYPAGDENIKLLVDRMEADPKRHHVVVAEDDELEIIGTIHIANLSADEVEFGVMVAEAYRKQGVSSQLMDYAITWCQNRNLRNIYMHCLGHNRAILHLVAKHGLEVSKEQGDADAKVTLPYINVFTLGKEAFLRQQNLVRDNIRSFRRILQV